MVATDVRPECFNDYLMPIKSDKEVPCNGYPFHRDSSMQLAFIFSILAFVLAWLSCLGAMCASQAFHREAPVTDPYRWIPGAVMIMAGVCSLPPAFILFHSHSLCHNVSTSQIASEWQPFALIIVQPHCYMGAGGYFSILGSICWFMLAISVLLPGCDRSFTSNGDNNNNNKN
jgi:hypothetical protein